MPSPGAFEMNNGPAHGAGPNVGGPENLIRADYTFIVDVANILMDSGDQICCGRFRQFWASGLLLGLWLTRIVSVRRSTKISEVAFVENYLLVTMG